MSSFFIGSGVCESEKDIQVLPLGIMIIERKDRLPEFSGSCSAPEQLKTYTMQENNYTTCVNYCSKAAIAGAAFCAHIFKTKKC
ncbi:hypothetical protein PHSC3_000855 [Chlamydiales bacterium STE3]|nr:hypothetical protein PHSC3_000855 [Chlamydiales bacterium STE3]